MRKIVSILMSMFILFFVMQVNVFAERRVVNNVPYIRQVQDMDDSKFLGYNACAPTSACMMAQFHNVQPKSPNSYAGWYVYNPYVGFTDKSGRNYSSDKARDWDMINELDSYNEHNPHEVCGTHGFIVINTEKFDIKNPYWAADPVKLVAYLQKHGLTASSTDKNVFNVIKQNIDAGLPLIGHSYVYGNGHYLVIVGYDTGTSGQETKVIVNDPYGDVYNTWNGSSSGEGKTYALSDSKVKIDKVFEVGYNVVKFTGSPTIYLSSGGNLWPILNDKVYSLLGFRCGCVMTPDWSHVISLPLAEKSKYSIRKEAVPSENNAATGNMIAYRIVPKVGPTSCMCIDVDTTRIYLFEDGKFCHIANEGVYKDLGYKADFSDVVNITPELFAYYGEGEEIESFSFNPISIFLSDSYDGSDIGGGAGLGEAHPAPPAPSAPYTFLRSTFCAYVQPNEPYSPFNESNTFSDGDKVMAWFKLEQVNTQVQTKAEFYLPNGNLFYAMNWNSVSNPNGRDWVFWNHLLTIPENAGCNSEILDWKGQWKVKIYVNSELVDTNHFTVVYNGEIASTVYYRDYDGDGYSNGETKLVCSGDKSIWFKLHYKLPEDLISTTAIDCDDYNDRIHPNALEFCSDGVDQNCDGIDNDCPPNGTIDTPAKEIITAYDVPVHFTGSAADSDNQTPFTYLWDFNGGAHNSTLEDPGDVYFRGFGIFTATFTVTDATGLSDPTPDTVQVIVRPGRSILVPDQYRTIQQAVNAANNGDLIFVRAGFYNGDVNFLGKSISLISREGSNVTQIYGRVMFDNSYGNTSNPEIRGFTITSSPYYTRIYSRRSSLIVADCIIKDGGQAIYGELSSITISGCDISGNRCSSNGGGVYVKRSTLKIDNSTISRNRSSCAGGGIYGEESPLTISDSEISGNTASYNGGGIYGRYSTIALTDCIISGNKVTIDGASGGGVYCDNGSGYTATFKNCLIVKNVAPYYSRYNFSVFGKGGGVYLRDFNSAAFSNCAIAGNNAAKGGGVYYQTSSATMTNCVFSGNFACGEGGAVYCYASSTTQITNSILWENGPSKIGVGNSSLAVSYCDVEGGYSGAGNINKNPLFVEASSGNYHLQSSSPCIGAGKGGANMGIE